MVADKLRGLPPFPEQLRTLVEHMILSHHGQLEFGSPKLPQFPEAVLLHYLDDLDSKMECMRAMVEKDRLVEGCFTSYNSAMGRTALKMDRYWNGAPKVEPAAVPAPLVVEQVAEAQVAEAQVAEAQVAETQVAETPAAVESPAAAEPPAAAKPPAPPRVPPAVPARPPAAPAARPVFVPKPDSVFGDKLKQALLAPVQERES
jgi:hypothetical protein